MLRVRAAAHQPSDAVDHAPRRDAYQTALLRARLGSRVAHEAHHASIGAARHEPGVRRLHEFSQTALDALQDAVAIIVPVKVLGTTSDTDDYGRRTLHVLALLEPCEAVANGVIEPSLLGRLLRGTLNLPRRNLSVLGGSARGVCSEENSSVTLHIIALFERLQLLGLLIALRLVLQLSVPAEVLARQPMHQAREV